jgi:predicted amidophosphoribosyltransferase
MDEATGSSEGQTEFCPQCGRELRPGANFCPRCGAPA